MVLNGNFGDFINSLVTTTEPGITDVLVPAPILFPPHISTESTTPGASATPPAQLVNARTKTKAVSGPLSCFKTK